MIQIRLNNELLDISTDAVVTYKKAQLLNGIQDQYSFSNNFNLLNSSKNRRLLGINYLPNSKAKAMTAGYDVDVVLSQCIYLKKQKLKVQKESKDSIPVYLVFTDSYLVAKAKEVLMNQIDIDTDYTKYLSDFLDYNTEANIDTRTAPISAQDQSGLVVVEEVPILINIKYLVLKVFSQLGYSYTGDILTDENIDDYYISSNVGVYGINGVPRFANTYTCYDFITEFLKTFNGYIEPSDSARSVGLYFWKNIETIKDNFVDYSDKFTSFTDYAFEGGLAKVNTLSFAESPDFYNGFFNNNKSIVDKTDYLSSGFGAGNLRLFADQDIEEDGTILLRTPGEITEPQTLNIFRFEDAPTSVPIYAEGALSYVDMFKAFSPNILEIWQLFHEPYCDNIAIPTISILNFRYDVIFLANFKMFEVFFIKQLSAYWLPLEQNFTSKKDGVKIKALMIEKTPVDIPIVYDYNISIDFYGEGLFNDISILYSALNTSPAATMIITAADLTKNNIYVNGIQVLAFPTAIDVSAIFEFKVEAIEAENVKSNSDVHFTFISEEGGVSRVATVNVAHNGRANYISEFRSTPDTVITYSREDVANITQYLNYSGKITTPINIPDTLAPLIGSQGSKPQAIIDFAAIHFDRAANVRIELEIANITLRARIRDWILPVQLTVKFKAIVNGIEVAELYSAGAIDSTPGPVATENIFLNVSRSTYVNVMAGDTLSIMVEFKTKRGSSGSMDVSVSLTNATWRFYVTEQI